MADLVRAQPAYKVEFLPSLGLDVLSTMGLICVVHDFEGLNEWVVEAAASLPMRLRHDMCLCMRAGLYPYIAVEALASRLAVRPDSAFHESIDGLLEALQSLSAADCQAILETMLERAVERSEIELTSSVAAVIGDQERLEELLEQLDIPVNTAELMNLLQEPLEWRNLLVSTVQRFWERVYSAEYAAQQSLRERNVMYHRSHGYSAHFPDLFAGVTGRLVPDFLYDRLADITQVRFVPSQYIGPYLAFLINGALLTVFYNSRVTPMEGDKQSERVQSLYQPLAALADKTRLQIMALLHGRELYAQEIVNLLDIHQSAVSRHLKLMETARVLTVRRDKGSKYYSINRQQIEEISARLRELI